MVTTSGLLQVHSTLPALCPHIEWAASGGRGMSVHLDWTPQNAERAACRVEHPRRVEHPWRGAQGTGARLARTFLGRQRVRCEVTQEPGPNGDGQRWSLTPYRGIFHAPTRAMGDLAVPEEMVREEMVRGAVDEELRYGPPAAPGGLR